MLDALQAARTASRDVPDHEAPSFGGAEPQGGVGRPQIDIRPDDIAALRTGRTSHTQLAEIYGCNPRTIRRRLLEFNMSTPGPPVYVNEVLPDGSSTRVYSAGRSSDLSRISDEDLDQLMRSIYQQFPSFGRRMIDGYLMALGHRVPRKRVIESYQRVVGPPVATFRRRRIQRRVYSVAGPGALWHHDGQHGELPSRRMPYSRLTPHIGLIRWKIVIHAFIDGFSRYLLGIRASNNNRAETVAALFDELVARHGYPVRVRGDHGTENLLVAARMERQRGPGSYIWGKYACLLPSYKAPLIYLQECSQHSHRALMGRCDFGLWKELERVFLYFGNQPWPQCRERLPHMATPAPLSPSDQRRCYHLDDGME